MHQLGDFNLGAYWKRKYLRKGPKDTWYILTSLANAKKTFPPESPPWGDIGGELKPCSKIAKRAGRI